MKFSRLVKFMTESTKIVVSADRSVPYASFESNGRENQPFLIAKKGDIIYLDSEGRLDREDGPAFISQKQGDRWFKQGKMHRIGGPAFRSPSGRISYYKEGMIHRDGGPAIIDPVAGTETWYSKGVKHRGDGPAYIKTDDGGDMTMAQWWINGEVVSKADFEKMTKHVSPENLQDVAEVGDLF